MSIFASKVNIYIIRTFLIGFIDIFVIYVVAHYLGPEPLGLVGYATAYLSLFFTFSELGFGNAHVKRVSEGKNIGECIGTYAFIKIILLTFLTLIIIVVTYIRSDYFHEFKNPLQETVIYLMLIPMLLNQLSMIPIKTFEGKKEAFKASVSNIIAPIISAPITITLAIIGFGVYALLIARSLSTLIIFLIPSYFLLKLPIKKPTIDSIKHYYSFAYKLFFLTFLTHISLQIDKLMIGEFDSTASVGIYYTVVSIIAFLNVIPDAVGNLLFPTISEEHSKGNFDNTLRYTQITERYITMILLPASVLLSFFSKDIINILLGKKFEAALIPLILLSVYYFINGTRKPIASLFAGTDRIGLLAKLSMISVFVNIFLNSILIPKSLFGIKLAGFGMAGAAIATLSSGFVYSGLCRYHASKKYNYIPEKRLIFHYVSGIGMFFFLYAVYFFFPLDFETKLINIILIILYSIVGLSVYILILFLLKEFDSNDVRLFINAVHPVKMKNYIKSEIKK